MEKTLKTNVLLMLFLVSQLAFPQAGVVYEKVSKSKANKYLDESKEIKDTNKLKNKVGKIFASKENKGKYSDGLKVFKGSIVKKYDLSPTDPYMTLGSSKEAQTGGVGGSNQQAYIHSLEREDVYDAMAYKNGDKELAYKKPDSENPRQYRCWHYTIRNASQGALNESHETECFLINSTGFVDGENEQIYDHDSEFNEIETKGVGRGCLKVVRCEPRRLKAKVSSSGKTRIGDKDTKKNDGTSKKSRRQRYKQIDNDMSIESCAGGCGEGFELIKVKYPLDEEAQEIREMIAGECQSLSESNYEPLEGALGYSSNLKGKGSDLLNKVFSDVYNADTDPINGMFTEDDKNISSKHFIYVNKCRKIEKDKKGENQNDDLEDLKKKDEEKKKAKTSKTKDETPAYNITINGNVINSPVIDSPGASQIYTGFPNQSGNIVSQGSGHWCGGHCYPLMNQVPQFAMVQPQAFGPGIIIINPGYFQQAMGVMQGGGYIQGGMVNSQNTYNQPIYTNNNNNNNNTTNNYDIRYREGDTITRSPLECYQEKKSRNFGPILECKSNQTGKKEIIAGEQSFKDIFTSMCKDISDEQFEKVKKSFQEQCQESFAKDGVDMAIAKDHLVTGDSPVEIREELEDKDVLVTSVRVVNESSTKNDMGKYLCEDDTKALNKNEDVLSKPDLYMDSYAFISLNPEDESNKDRLKDDKDKQNLNNHYKETVKNIERTVDYMLSPLKYDKKVDDVINFIKSGKDAKGESTKTKFSYSGLYTYSGKTPFEDAKKRMEVNTKLIKDVIKKKLDEYPIEEAKRKELLSLIEHQESKATMVGPIPFVDDEKEMKSMLQKVVDAEGKETPYASCSDKKGAKAIYECSKEKGCARLNGKMPNRLKDVCDGTKNLTLQNDALFSSFDLDIYSNRDEKLLSHDKSRMIQISCDVFRGDGGEIKEVAVTKIQYKREAREESVYVRDEKCLEEFKSIMDAGMRRKIEEGIVSGKYRVPASGSSAE